MSWGDPFRDAWKKAGPSAHAAARDAVLGPESSAAALSDEIAHTLQLAQFAARDLQRVRGEAIGEDGNDAPAPPGMDALRRAMDEVRHGRIPPDKAERHLQQAVRAVSKQAKQPLPDDRKKPDEDDLQLARLRLRELRRKISYQCAQLRERACQTLETPGADNDIERLAQAFATLGRAFLENKRVDDPAAPLPASLCDHQSGA